MNIQQHREALLNKAKQLAGSGLSQGKSGNISVRCGEQVLITPSGADYQQLTAADMVLLPLDYHPAKHSVSGLPPSSEWHFHLGIYKARPDLNAVVHAHPVFCTALACTGRAIPAFHYMVAIAGGNDIPLAPYALFGTEQLSEYVVKALTHRQACLLETHGMIASGDNLEKAFNLAIEVETLAEQYIEALKIGGVKLLTDQQMAQVHEKFSHYGQRV